MPSPFPGMDPYLERTELWKECHTALIYLIHAQLNAQLPEGYVASTDIHVWLQEADGESRLRREPDVFVSDVNGGGTAVAAQPATSPPVEIVLPVVEKKGNRFVSIVDKSNNRVITAIEILSPANKVNGPDRDAYLSKRDDYFLAKVNLIEIDLLRSGLRPPLSEIEEPPFDYYVMVCRNSAFPKAGFWRIGLRDRLPSVPVPLKAGDPDCSIELRSCLDRGYEDGRWRQKAAYDRPLEPPLSAADAAWARELIANQSQSSSGNKV